MRSSNSIRLTDIAKLSFLFSTIGQSACQASCGFVVNYVFNILIFQVRISNLLFFQEKKLN